MTIARLAYRYGLTGRKREAMEMFVRLEEISEHTYVEPAFIAHAYTGMGEKDKPFAYLKKPTKTETSTHSGL